MIAWPLIQQLSRKGRCDTLVGPTALEADPVISNWSTAGEGYPFSETTPDLNFSERIGGEAVPIRGEMGAIALTFERTTTPIKLYAMEEDTLLSPNGWNNITNRKKYGLKQQMVRDFLQMIGNAFPVAQIVARNKEQSVSDKCQLCKKAIETYPHMQMGCEKTEKARSKCHDMILRTLLDEIQEAAPWTNIRVKPKMGDFGAWFW
mmetsp:Transcript_62389/g.129494  ORF Transcript_62389/g.129494 Transcript_62389/m.129494 type:complete len:205 (+) Transcript_62389:2887-3501(+)